MSEAIKTLVLGDNDNAPYHPLKPVEGLLKNIIQESVKEKCIEITVTEDRSELEIENLTDYHLFVCYADTWGSRLTQSQLAGILNFTAAGGALVVIHNGICFQNNSEYAKLVGAKFINHPPYQKLQYKSTGSGHSIMEGIPDFSMEEEPYFFEIDQFNDGIVLMEYTNGEITNSAAWAHEYGLGRVVYLAPGHNEKSFQCQQYQALIQRSILWSLKDI